MKSRTRKLAWLLSATMVFTSVNPGMMAEEQVEESAEAIETYEYAIRKIKDELIAYYMIGY